MRVVCRACVGLQDKMTQLIMEKDMATGHAFVVFNYERDRDRCARLFCSTPRSLLYPCSRSNPGLDLT
jgi:hypothetical protein